MGQMLFMKLIVGLGNPGEKHRNNRHNVGFMVVDKFAIQLFGYKAIQQRWKLEKRFDSSLITLDSSLILAKPQTFMNASGTAVKKLVDWFKVKLEGLYIIHDDLDIPLGEYKIQRGKGPKLHYGIQSIDKALGASNYWRVRVGVDNRNPSNRVPGEEYVLQDFTPKEQQIFADVVERIIADLKGRLL